MSQICYAALVAALFVIPGTSFAQGNDPDAAAQSGVHKEAGKDVDVRVHGDANAGANVSVDGKTQAEIDAKAKADADAQAGDNKPQ